MTNFLAAILDLNLSKVSLKRLSYRSLESTSLCQFCKTTTSHSDALLLFMALDIDEAAQLGPLIRIPFCCILHDEVCVKQVEPTIFTLITP